MPIVTDSYTLSLTQDNRILRVRCSQNDTSRQVNFTIYNNGTLFTIPSGLSVSVHGIKQNGNIFTKSCSYSGSVVTLVLGTQITDIAGISVAELVFTDSSGGKIGTSNFIFQVESDPLLRGTISITEETPTEYISDLVSMIEALSARVNNIIAPAGEASLSEVVDARLSGYSGTTYQNLKARIDADFAALDSTKADKSDTYTKEEVDAAINNVTITTDETLSIHGAAADAKETGDAISEINGSLGDVKADLKQTEDELIETAGVIEELECGLPEEVKTALLACFEQVAWIGADGQTYYNALSNALNRSRVLSSISAVFTQGSAVIYDTDELYALKQYLTVTATYDDGSTKDVNNYTLNGKLVAGTSTITAAYNKKTTTFNVNVTHQAKTLESISATFNSSASITTDNALDDLRPYLTVHATYSDGSTNTITNYTLSGSLNVGTNTITAIYSGKTATFTVNVTQAEKTLQSITAVFNQGSTVIYMDSSLNDLKPYLTVTARYSDSTSQTVTNYTLSGTLAEGTSIITASYGGKIATFNVTVSPVVTPKRYIAQRDIAGYIGIPSISVSNGTISETSPTTFSCVVFDQSIEKMWFYLHTHLDSRRRPRYIFKKDADGSFYGIDENATSPKLYKFTLDTDGTKYNATQILDISSITTLTKTGDYFSTLKKEMNISNGVLAVTDADSSISFTNANCFGYWQAAYNPNIVAGMFDECEVEADE